MTNTSFHPQKHQPQQQILTIKTPPLLSHLFLASIHTTTSFKIAKDIGARNVTLLQVALALHLNVFYYYYFSSAVWKMVDYSGFKLRSNLYLRSFLLPLLTFFLFIFLLLMLYKIISKEPEIYIESLSFCLVRNYILYKLYNICILLLLMESCLGDKLYFHIIT